MKKNVIIEDFSKKCFKYMDILPYKTQLKDFLSLSLDRCMKAVDADSGSVFLLDGRKRELVLEVNKNHKDVDLRGTRMHLGENVVGRVALAKKPFLVEDIDSDPLFSSRTKYSHYKSKSFLSVPLEFSGDLIGVINFTDKKEGLVFDCKDLETILDICKNLGIAIYSLKHYLKKQAEENKKLRDELQSLKKSIASSKKFSSLGKLVGGLVHEINNPLDGAMRYVNLTSKCIDEGDVASEYLGEVKKGLNRIAVFVRSLLDFSWSLSHQEGDEINVNTTIDESLLAFNHYATRHKVEVKKIFDPSMPKIPDYKLKIVFNNIIKNACESMKQGGVLTVYTSFEDSRIKIIFKDTGSGIPTDVQERIFEPFFTTKSMGEGSGLGLAISHEVVQRYKGEIFVESVKGEGTLFTIHLPITK